MRENDVNLLLVPLRTHPNHPIKVKMILALDCIFGGKKYGGIFVLPGWIRVRRRLVGLGVVMVKLLRGGGLLQVVVGVWWWRTGG